MGNRPSWQTLLIGGVTGRGPRPLPHQFQNRPVGESFQDGSIYSHTMVADIPILCEKWQTS